MDKFNKLFEDPAKKLQSWLKGLFLAFTGIEVIILWFSKWALTFGQMQYLFNSSTWKYGNASSIFSSIGGNFFICLLGTIAIFLVNYIGCLSSYVLLDFFADIHDIKKATCCRELTQKEIDEFKERGV